MIDVLVRVGGGDEDAVRDRIDWLIVGGLEVEPDRAARRPVCRRHPLPPLPPHASSISHADAVCVATAMTVGSGLATCDADLAAVARSLDVPVVASPDSAGRMPAKQQLAT